MLKLLHVAVLGFCLVPSLLCANLLCYHSPVLEKEKKVTLTVTECPPQEQCFKANGNHSLLSARGCMAKKDCSQKNSLPLNGSIYIMTYACCDRPYCNSSPSVTAKFSITLALVTVAVMAGSL